MARLQALFIMDEASFGLCYGPEERQAIAERVDLISEPHSGGSILGRQDLLREVEAIFSGWGAPVMDSEFLDAAPRLKAIFYAAGSVAGWMTQKVWERGIVVSSAYAANAIPVAEYTTGVILFSLKHGWNLARQTRALRSYPARDEAPGCYGSTVGLVSMGVIGRAVRRLLQAYDVNVLAYDPYLSGAEAELLDVESVGLEELFAHSDVVSVHTPLLTETVGMIRGKHLSAMKPGATFINTARGTIVREEELIETAQRRPDLQFVLDVAELEPPGHDSLLYTLENVLLTPHIAGSVGRECRRMGRYVVEELDRYLAHKPLHWQVTPELARNSCHRLLVHVNSKALRRQSSAIVGAGLRQ